MDMYAAALLDTGMREMDIEDLSCEIYRLKLKRGRLQAGQAIALLRELAPHAAQARFWGPQEPGDTASIQEITTASGGVLYSVDLGVFDLEDELTPAQDYLTAALENDATFTMNDGGEFLLDLTRR
jgi:hypothetical protein